MRIKKLLAGLLVVAVMLLVGCVQPITQPYTPPSTPQDNNTPPAPLVTPPVTPTTPETPEVVLPGANVPPENMTWISPGKVMVGNFYPGARAEYPLTVHNGNDTTASFSIYYRYPDHVGAGYEMPPTEAQDWVIVADPTPVLMPRETRDILITLDMPENASISTPKWEFWIGVKDTTQTGMVHTELATRWLISMRGS
jgi:hypothetical protein